MNCLFINNIINDQNTIQLTYTHTLINRENKSKNINESPGAANNNIYEILNLHCIKFEFFECGKKTETCVYLFFIF